MLCSKNFKLKKFEIIKFRWFNEFPADISSLRIRPRNLLNSEVEVQLRSRPNSERAFLFLENLPNQHNFGIRF